jgi:hypothetical protein
MTKTHMLENYARKVYVRKKWLNCHMFEISNVCII